MKNKRGISPLIATVLLVAFSIALAAIVSTYVIQQTKKFKPMAIVEDSLLCDDVSLDYDIEDPQNLQYETSGSICTLKGITLVNKGAFSIYKYIITSPGLGTSPEQFFLNEGNNEKSPILPQGTRKITIGLKNREDKLIKITPIVKDPEKENTFVKCTRRQLIFDHVKLCAEFNCVNPCN